MSRILLIVLTLLPWGPAGVAGAGGTPAGPAPVAAVDLLRGWDAARARAWADGRPAELRPLYTRGSVAGRRDRAMLRAWTRRGLVVSGLELQVLSVRTLRRTRTHWRLVVVDRVAGGTAVGAGLRRELPADPPRRHVVSLRWAYGAWRVAGVRSG